jgi:hypothetical protein
MSGRDIDPSQQDGATARTANNVLDAVPTAKRDRIICHTLWPAHSPDLRPCGYLWRSLKDKACKNNPHTEDGLKSQARSM